ncbi:hypothetical protein FMO001_43990 [Moritella sp. F1]|nr:hypothetical protein FMO001_43990 [Moritella sp. F1]
MSLTKDIRKVALSEVPAGEVPAGEVPAGEVPAGEVPAGEVPPGKVPPGKVSSNRILELKTEKSNAEKWSELFQFRWWLVVLSSISGAVFVYMQAIQNVTTEITSVKAIPVIILGGVTGVLIYGVLVGYIKLLFGVVVSKIDIKLAKEGAEELQEKIEENFFTKLVQINFKYIDQYYLQTQEQANKSFRLAMFACVSGLLIVTVGIVMMFQGKVEPAYVTTATGLLTEFIAAIFFYLYNKTIVKMSEYHQKLVITQNISLALKIAETLPEKERVESQQELIKKLTENVNQFLSLNSNMAEKRVN